MNKKSMEDEALRLLIVDDEEAARYGMRRALGGGGYEIAEAGSVEAARTQLGSFHPDLLLLDVNLPGESGLDFLPELQRGGEDRPLVIMITAHGSERMAVEAIKGARMIISPSRLMSMTCGSRSRTRLRRCVCVAKINGCASASNSKANEVG